MTTAPLEGAPPVAAPPVAGPIAARTSLGDRLGPALLDSLVAAFIAAALFGPLMGLKAVPGGGGMILVERWPALLITVAIVFAGRLLLSLFVFGRTGIRLTPRQLVIAAGAVLVGLFVLAWARGIVDPVATIGSFRPQAVAAYLGTAVVIAALWRFLGAGVALFVLALVWPFVPVLAGHPLDRYLLDIGITILTYVMLGWGLNIVVGLAGLLDLGYVAFYAVGAYSFALLAQHFGMTFWMCLPIAGLLAALWGVILGFPVLRLRGDYLAIVTLAFGEIIRIVLLNWYEFTGGPNGLSSIPSATFFGIPFNASENGFAATFGIDFSPNQKFVFLFYLILALAMVTYAATNRLRRLPIGRAWEALREDEIACRSLGINTRNTKLTAFAIGAMFGGFAGSFFATKQQFISPESFNFGESALILAVVVLGGLGNQVGIVMASIAMFGGLELLRNLTFLKQVFGPDFDPSLYRLLIFGIAMVVIMVWRPRGLVSQRTPSIALKEKRAIGADLVAEGRG